MKNKNPFASIPTHDEQVQQENALFDAVMDVFDKLKPSTLTVVVTMMRIGARAALIGGSNAEKFAAGARAQFEEQLSESSTTT